MHRSTLLLVGFLTLASGSALAAGPKDHGFGARPGRDRDVTSLDSKPVGPLHTRRGDRASTSRATVSPRSEPRERTARSERREGRLLDDRARHAGTGVFIGDHELTARELGELERLVALYDAQFEAQFGAQAPGGFDPMFRGDAGLDLGNMPQDCMYEPEAWWPPAQEQQAYNDALMNQANLLQWYAQFGGWQSQGFDFGQGGGMGGLGFDGSGVWGDLSGPGAMGTEDYVMTDTGNSWWPGK